MMELGPLRFGAIDPEGRRFPCACHLEPSHWLLATITPTANGRLVYCTIPISDKPDFSTAFDKLLATFQHEAGLAPGVQ